MIFFLKKVLCVLSSFVIAFGCFCLPVSAQTPYEAVPKGYEIGDCIYNSDDEFPLLDFLVLDSNGYWRLKEDSSKTLYNFQLNVFIPDKLYCVVREAYEKSWFTALCAKPIVFGYENSSGKLKSFYGSGVDFCTGRSSSSSNPCLVFNKESSTSNACGFKSFKIFEVNIAGTKGIWNIGTGFGFLLDGVGYFVDTVGKNPVLMLGIAMFCCGCAIAVYYRFRS